MTTTERSSHHQTTRYRVPRTRTSTRGAGRRGAPTIAARFGQQFDKHSGVERTHETDPFLTFRHHREDIDVGRGVPTHAATEPISNAPNVPSD